MVHRASENTRCISHVYVCVWVYIRGCKLCVGWIQCKEGRRVRWERWVNTGEKKGRERHRDRERKSETVGKRERERDGGEATAIHDFHFNWTQRNIILNARNASETPIKRRRHFTLSPCTFVLIAGPIVAEVAIDYSSPEISRRSAPHVRTRRHRIYMSSVARSRVAMWWIARRSSKTNSIPHAFNAKQIQLTSMKLRIIHAELELCGEEYIHISRQFSSKTRFFTIHSVSLRIYRAYDIRKWKCKS